jgi:hypothetical protein
MICLFFGPHYPANVRKMSLQGDALLASHPKHVWPGFFFLTKNKKKIKVVSRQGLVSSHFFNIFLFFIPGDNLFYYFQDF